MRGVPEGQLDERCQSDNNARSMEEREAVLAKLEEHRADLSRLGVKSWPSSGPRRGAKAARTATSIFSWISPTPWVCSPSSN